MDAGIKTEGLHVWKRIPNIRPEYAQMKGTLEASSDGKIREVGKDGAEIRTLKQYVVKKYYHAQVYNASRGESESVHRLVAAAFFGPLPKGFHTHYKDGNQLNNSALNLEYVDPEAHLKLHARLKISELGVFRLLFAYNYCGIKPKLLSKAYNISEAMVKELTTTGKPFEKTWDLFWSTAWGFGARQMPPMSTQAPDFDDVEIHNKKTKKSWDGFMPRQYIRNHSVEINI